MSAQAASSPGINLTADELKNIVREVIREELTACGVLASTPAERVEMQEDFSFLRRWRKLYDDTVNKVGTTVILMFVGGLASLVALGINLKFGGSK